MTYFLLINFLHFSPINPPIAAKIKKKITSNGVKWADLSANVRIFKVGATFKVIVIKISKMAIIFKLAIKMPNNHPFSLIIYPAKKLLIDTGANFDIIKGVVLVNIIPKIIEIEDITNTKIKFFTMLLHL